MSVANIHRGDRFDVYIGRPGKGAPGPFGNPIRLGAPCVICGRTHTRREQVAPGAALVPALECYRRWLWHRLKADPAFAAAVAGLAGKVLGCFCSPGPCHGDVLTVAADYLANRRDIATRGDTPAGTE